MTTPDAAQTRAPMLNVLRSRYVPRLLSASLIGRLPTGMAPLAIVLLVRAHGGDYRTAGTLAALYAGAAAVCGPVLGRLIDRTRQPPMLIGCGVLSAVGFLGLALLDPVAQYGSALVMAVLAGAATPQLEPCLRVLWEHVVTGERNVRAAFSLDAATQELIFVCGPVVVMAVSGFGPSAGLLAAALIGLMGALWFGTARPAREWTGQRHDQHWAGPLRSAAMIRLFLVLVFVGLTIGAFTVGMTGHAEANGRLDAAGWLIALNAAGALAGGVIYTVVPAARQEDRRFLTLLFVLAVGYLPLVVAADLWIMAPLAVLSGCGLPPVLASAFSLVARMAPQGTITEAHAWMITSFGVGNALGSALAGAAIDLSTAAVAFVIAAGASVLGAALAIPRMLPTRR